MLYTVKIDVPSVSAYTVPVDVATEADAPAAAIAALKASAGANYSCTVTVPSFTAAKSVKLAFTTEKATP